MEIDKIKQKREKMIKCKKITQKKNRKQKIMKKLWKMPMLNQNKLKKRNGKVLLQKKMMLNNNCCKVLNNLFKKKSSKKIPKLKIMCKIF